jgi:hypothetical protein
VACLALAKSLILPLPGISMAQYVSAHVSCSRSLAMGASRRAPMHYPTHLTTGRIAKRMYPK